MQSIVELDNVSVSYERVRVLEGITLRVNKGDFLGLLGPNGAGKTTLLKVIVGLVPVGSGRVNVLGGSVEGKRHSEGAIGYVPQKTPLQIQNLPATVKEVVSTGLGAKKGFVGGKHDRAKKIQEALELVDVQELKDRKIGELSGGQVQRALIARALVGDPLLLILDEPTSNIDLSMRSTFFSLLGKLNKEKEITIIVSSHDVAAVSELSTQVACVNRRLFFHGHPKNFTSDKLSEAYGYPVTLVPHERHG